LGTYSLKEYPKTFCAQFIKSHDEILKGLLIEMMMFNPSFQKQFPSEKKVLVFDLKAVNEYILHKRKGWLNRITQTFDAMETMFKFGERELISLDENTL